MSDSRKKPSAARRFADSSDDEDAPAGTSPVQGRDSSPVASAADSSRLRLESSDEEENGTLANNSKSR